MVVDLKRDANPQVVLNQLYTFTQMQTTFGVIMLALVNGEPRVLTLKEVLEIILISNVKWSFGGHVMICARRKSARIFWRAF